MSKKKPQTRRDFLSRTAAGAGAMMAASAIGSPAIFATRSPSDVVNLGIVGVGIRGNSLMSTLGYVNPYRSVYEKSKGVRIRLRAGTPDGRPSRTLNFRGVCDVFEGYRKFGMESADQGPSKGKVRGYRDYRKMLEDKSIDGVIIATPDHWHAQMAIDAMDAGKDIYLEKCMTRIPEEAFQVVKAVKRNKAVFQLGHQGRQDLYYKKAREIIQSGMLGDVHLVETYTNRNTPKGAWQYSIPRGAEDASRLDWDMWLGKAPKIPYDPLRCWQWRRFWDYGTGMSGDLLSHALDAVNMIMDMGIPHSAVASGGVYVWKDGREVPDVFQVVFDFPNRDLTVTYNGNLGSSYSRGKKFFGRDATLEIARSGLTVQADAQSKRYKDKLVYSFKPEGKKVNSVWLHITEWLESIKTRRRTSANEDTGFEEAMTAHMATAAYRSGRKAIWDLQKRRIIT